MNKIDLNTYGVKELSTKEQKEANGGAEYLKYTWSNQPGMGIFDAAANGVKAVINGCIWIYNQLS